MLMVVPVDADVDEAQYIAQQDRQYRQQRFGRIPMRHLQFEHHDGDDDRDHAVTERLQPALTHAHPLLNFAASLTDLPQLCTLCRTPTSAYVGGCFRRPE